MTSRILTTKFNRITVVDVLRGFALGGILYAHMTIWYTGAAIPDTVYEKYDKTADLFAMAVFGALVLRKFFSIFSFLFGLSFFLFFDKNRDKPDFNKVYIWRLSILLIIGLLHHLIWRGDILSIYAALGFLLLLFVRIPSVIIILTAIILILNLPTHLYDIFNPPSTISDEITLPMEEQAGEYYRTVKEADLFTVMQNNWESWFSKIKFQLTSGRILMTFGYFLLGLYAGRSGWFRGIKMKLGKFKFWNRLLGAGILIQLNIGLLLVLNDQVTFPDIKVSPGVKDFAAILFSLYNATVTLFYITGIVIFYNSLRGRRILKPLASMGKMALTIYLMQTLIGLALFYDFGLGLFDKTSPAMNAIIFIIVFVAQLHFSQWWLLRYRQGPMEWLWRSLTYLKIQPIGKEVKSLKL